MEGENFDRYFRRSTGEINASYASIIGKKEEISTLGENGVR